jgi:hypothetical protein
MIVVGVICLGLGVVLSQYCSVLILLPTFGVAAAAGAITELACGRGLGYAPLAGASAICTLQFGYFLGLGGNRLAVGRRKFWPSAAWRNGLAGPSPD